MIKHFNREYPTQEGPALEDIKKPKHRYQQQDFDETLEILFDRALETGEQVSQGNIARGRGPAPRAHMACTSYFAIEIIRQLQADLADAYATIEELETLRRR